MMISLIALALSYSKPQTGLGLPTLVAPNPYRILSEHVQVVLVPSEEARVDSLTVYRNLGQKENAQIFIPWSSAVSKTLPSSIMWDKVPVAITLDPTGAGVKLHVALGTQATHSLRIRYYTPMSKSGYAEGESEIGYQLSGDHPIELFVMSYRYPSGSVFGLPTMQPDLGWEIGNRGTSIRKENFNPGDVPTRIRLYWNPMYPVGGM